MISRATYFVSLVAFVSLLAGGVTSTSAAAPEEGIPAEVQDAVKSFKTADAAARQKIYDLLASKGDARLIPALKAYKDGSLQIRDGRLVVFGPREDVPGTGPMLTLLDALTGQAVTGPDGAKLHFPKIDLSAAIKAPPRAEKGTLNDLISQLSLLDPDPAARLQSIRGIADRAGRAFISDQDTNDLLAVLRRCQTALDAERPADPKAAAAVKDAAGTLKDAQSERPSTLISAAPSAATVGKVITSLSALQPLYPPPTAGTVNPAGATLNDLVPAGLVAAHNFTDRIEAQQKTLDELGKFAPALRTQLSKDPNGRFAPALNEAIASLDLVMGDSGARIEAASTLGKTGTSRAENILQKAVGAANRCGDSALQQAAGDALARADRYQTFVHILSNTFYGLSTGSILVLLALGLSIIFGLMGVINMAHGEFMMIGAFTTYVVSEAFKHLPASCFPYYPIAAVPAAFFVAGFVGFLCEVLVVRHLYGRPLETLLATVGIGLILVQSARVLFGDTLRVTPPPWMEGGVEVATDLVFSLNRVYIIVYCAICIVTVHLLVNRTKLGLLLRATTQNRNMAAALGVATRRIDAITFAFGAGLAGLAGVAVPLYDKINPGMGQDYVVDSFMVVVVGGVGKLAGVIWAGLGMGFLSKYLEPLLQRIPAFESGASVIGKVIVLALIVAFLQWKPSGLFPPKGRMADA